MLGSTTGSGSTDPGPTPEDVIAGAVPYTDPYQDPRADANAILAALAAAGFAVLPAADVDAAARLPSASALAQMFHENYERLAPDFGYRTREASAVPWSDVPAGNKALMIATCVAVLDELAAVESVNPEGEA